MEKGGWYVAKRLAWTTVVNTEPDLPGEVAQGRPHG